MDNYNEFDNQFDSPMETNETAMGGEEAGVQNAGSNGNTAVSLKEKAVTALDDVKGRAVDMKEKLSERAVNAGNQLGQTIDSNRGKASQGLRSTSQRIEKVATYLDEHEARDMGDALLRGSEDLIRRYPGKSIVAGILVGIILGRAFR